MIALLDTDVLIEILRGKPEALAWINSQKGQLVAIPSISYMEVLVGCRNKMELASTQKLLSRFGICHISEDDSDLACNLMVQNLLSSGCSIPDCLVAAMAINRGATLLTFNLKHFKVFAGLSFTAPYTRS